MSWQAVKWARGRAPTGALQLVLWGVCEPADPCGITYAGQKAIAAGCSSSERTVRGGLAQLEQLRLIARVPRYSGGHRRSDYIVVAPLAADRGELLDVDDEQIDRGYPEEVCELARAGLPAASAGKDPKPADLAGKTEVLPARSAVQTGNNRPSKPATIDRPKRQDLPGEPLKEESSENPQVNRPEPGEHPGCDKGPDLVNGDHEGEVGRVVLTGHWLEMSKRIPLEAEYARIKGIDIEQVVHSALSIDQLQAVVEESR